MALRISAASLSAALWMPHSFKNTYSHHTKVIQRANLISVSTMKMFHSVFGLQTHKTILYIYSFLYNVQTQNTHNTQVSWNTIVSLKLTHSLKVLFQERTYDICIPVWKFGSILFVFGEVLLHSPSKVFRTLGHPKSWLVRVDLSSSVLQGMFWRPFRKPFQTPQPSWTTLLDCIVFDWTDMGPRRQVVCL